MKIRAILLTASLAVNLWAAYHVLRPTSSAPAPTDGSSPALADPSASSDPTTANVTTQTTTAPRPSADLGPLWPRLDHENLADFATALRTAGFPENVVQAIVLNRIDAALTAQRESAGLPDASPEYWRSRSRPTIEQMATINRVMSARQQLIVDTLGDAYLQSPEHLDQLRRGFGDFAPAKLLALEAIQNDYQSMMMEQPGAMMGQQSETTNLLQSESAADIEAALGPTDYLEYKLRSSPLASTLRNSLAGFATTEAEFRAVYLALDDGTTGTGFQFQPTHTNPLSSLQDPTKSAAILGQLAQSMPPARIADLQQLLDPDARQENAFVARLGLPVSTAAAITAIRTELKNLNPGRGPIAPETQAALLETVTGMTTKLKTLLGEENFQQMQSNTFLRIPTAESLAKSFARPQPTPGG